MKFLAQIQAEFVKLSRTWDELTLREQKGYLSRHPRSRRRLTAKPPLTSPGGMAIYDPRRGHAHKILKALRNKIGVDGSPVWKQYLTYRSGSSNKFHYFSVFERDGEYVAANAWGRIGYDPKVTIFGSGPSEKQAIAVAQDKMFKKRDKGYEPTKL